MLELRQKFLLFRLCIAVFLAAAPFAAGEPKGTEGIWDPARYIGLDEIRPGMEAYCLTEYGVAGIEKFGMEVVDVVRNINPSSGPGSIDAILVKGTDERFMHTGPVAGCSGSPVYIDGRLAGALAFTWNYAKDPLYCATPIAEMLAVGQGRDSTASGQGGLNFDFTEPLDFAEVERRLTDRLLGSGLRGGSRFPQVLITAGVPDGVREQLSDFAEPFGLTVVAGGSTRSEFGVPSSARGVPRTAARSTQNTERQARLTPGSCLAVPLVSGDISMSVYGTVTEVVGDKVYGFGHYFLGYGPIDLPMAGGRVHTVVSNLASSFKLASATETLGAFTTDEAAGVVGMLGAEAKTIPLTIDIDRYNDIEKRIYNCRLVNNQLLTPFYLRMAVAAAAFQLGDFPTEHTVEYKVAIGISRSSFGVLRKHREASLSGESQGPRSPYGVPRTATQHSALSTQSLGLLTEHESIDWRNVSSGMGVNELIGESYSAVGLLMNNPYGRPEIESIDVDLRILPKSIISHIWSVDLSDAKVRASRSVEITAVLESVLAGKKQYQWSMEIPEDMPAGTYDLTICGQRDYEQFLVKAAGHRFIAQSAGSLIEALNNSLQFKRDVLYCMLSQPSAGVVIEKQELPGLPPTKSLLLQDAKRTLRVRPYNNWIEKRINTDTVVIDKKILKITVEK